MSRRQPPGLPNSNQPDLSIPATTIFITGATGFIGQRLVSALISQGYCVRAMIRPGRHRDARLPAVCEQIPVNLTDVDTLSIGFGDKYNQQVGGSGLMFFDDIRLYRPPDQTN